MSFKGQHNFKVCTTGGKFHFRYSTKIPKIASKSNKYFKDKL